MPGWSCAVCVGGACVGLPLIHIHWKTYISAQQEGTTAEGVCASQKPVESFGALNRRRYRTRQKAPCAGKHTHNRKQSVAVYSPIINAPTDHTDDHNHHHHQVHPNFDPSSRGRHLLAVTYRTGRPPLAVAHLDTNNEHDEAQTTNGTKSLDVNATANTTN